LTTIAQFMRSCSPSLSAPDGTCYCPWKAYYRYGNLSSLYSWWICVQFVVLVSRCRLECSKASSSLSRWSSSDRISYQTLSAQSEYASIHPVCQSYCDGHLYVTLRSPCSTSTVSVMIRPSETCCFLNQGIILSMQDFS
jgi:hypothetical protein